MDKILNTITDIVRREVYYEIAKLNKSHSFQSFLPFIHSKRDIDTLFFEKWSKRVFHSCISYSNFQELFSCNGQSISHS